MKRAKSLFNQIISYENLRLAWLKARKGKTSKKSVINFSRNVNQNLKSVYDRMICEPPVFSSYVQFKVFDPKERIISVVPFSDRVIHHAIINVLEPVFERQFIFHTYACRKNKGTHSAARYALRLAHKYKYFLKLDVRKYFDSINHEILKEQLSRIIKDKKCLELLFSLIESYSANEGVSFGASGLPIGNLTSQFFANLYLSPLDHFILENLKPCGYVRYMDDIVIFENSFGRLKTIFVQIERFCTERLELFFKPPVFGRCNSGIPFLGWRITSNGVRILRKTRRRMNRKLLLIQNDYELGLCSEEKACDRANSVYSARCLL